MLIGLLETPETLAAAAGKLLLSSFLTFLTARQRVVCAASVGLNPKGKYFFDLRVIFSITLIARASNGDDGCHINARKGGQMFFCG